MVKHYGLLWDVIDCVVVYPEWGKRAKGKNSVDIEGKIFMRVTLYGSLYLNLLSSYKTNIWRWDMAIFVSHEKNIV